jgi:hypothetical protein
VAKDEILNLETFHFRGLHPLVSVGTASDRYAGWMGADLHAGALCRPDNPPIPYLRGQGLGGGSASGRKRRGVFRAFPGVELDFTVYRFLLEEDGQPTSNYHVLRTYREHPHEGDSLIFKVPQVIFAQKLLRGGAFVAN